MIPAQPVVDAVTHMTQQMSFSVTMVSGIVFVVGFGLLILEVYSEARRKAAGRIWKNL